MQIYIMRHGEAQGFEGQCSVEDSQRVLNKQGEEESLLMADWFKKMNIKPIQVFVSPYVRAQQTCDIVTGKMDVAITSLDFITPLDDAKPVHDFIDGWLSDYKGNTAVDNEDASLLIISHMPLVCYLVAELTQTDNAPLFATAGVAHIDYDIDKMQGSLQTLTSP